MSGEVDILLGGGFQPATQSDGDTATISGNVCFLQTLRVEAASAEYDLWYDPDWGWSLIDFAGRQHSELAELEIEQRVRRKLSAHEDISAESVAVIPKWSDEAIGVEVWFRVIGDDELHQLNASIGKTEIEVIIIA